MDLHYFTPQPSPFSTASRVTSISLPAYQSYFFILYLMLIPLLFLSYSSLIPLLFLYYVRASCSSLVFISPVHTNSRTIKNCRLRERNETRYFKDRCPER